MNLKMALERLRLMARSYRRDDAVDPETFIAGAAKILICYPIDVGMTVTDPRDGLPSKTEYLPSLAKVTAECERLNDLRHLKRPAPKREPEFVRDPPEVRARAVERARRMFAEEKLAEHEAAVKQTADEAAAARIDAILRQGPAPLPKFSQELLNTMRLKEVAE